MFKIINKTQNTIISQKTKLANTCISRFVGLLDRSSLEPEEALLLKPCSSVHMFFMRFSIDVIFVNHNDCVVGLVRNLKPFQLSPLFFKASYAIELPKGLIDSTKTSVGDQIVVLEIQST